MTTLYRRCWRLSFFNKDGNKILTLQESVDSVNSYRVQFKIKQIIYIVNYVAQFNVFNLSEKSRGIIAKANRLTFEVGYDDVLKTIHEGLIVNAIDERQQPDYILTLITQDIFNNAGSLEGVSQPNQTDRQFLKSIFEKISGIVIQDENLQGLTDKPLNKYIVIPSVNYVQAAKRLSDELNVNIWVTNKVLYTNSKAPKALGTQAARTVLLNYKNGMIGSPQVDIANSGINVKSLINAELIPGSFAKIETLAPQIQVEQALYIGFNQTQATRGTWQIFNSEHVGDSKGQEWYSTIAGFSPDLILENAKS